MRVRRLCRGNDSEGNASAVLTRGEDVSDKVADGGAYPEPAAPLQLRHGMAFAGVEMQAEAEGAVEKGAGDRGGAAGLVLASLHSVSTSSPRGRCTRQ